MFFGHMQPAREIRTGLGEQLLGAKVAGCVA